MGSPFQKFEKVPEISIFLRVGNWLKTCYKVNESNVFELDNIVGWENFCEYTLCIYVSII